MSYLADALKEKGNTAFREGNFHEAEDFYTQAVQKYSRNPLIFTNRANVRLKLQKWDDTVNDCLKSIEVSRQSEMITIVSPSPGLLRRGAQRWSSSDRLALSEILAYL